MLIRKIIRSIRRIWMKFCSRAQHRRATCSRAPRRISSRRCRLKKALASARAGIHRACTMSAEVEVGEHEEAASPESVGNERRRNDVVMEIIQTSWPRLRSTSPSSGTRLYTMEVRRGCRCFMSRPCAHIALHQLSFFVLVLIRRTWARSSRSFRIANPP